MAWLNQQGKV